MSDDIGPPIVGCWSTGLTKFSTSKKHLAAIVLSGRGTSSKSSRPLKHGPDTERRLRDAGHSRRALFVSPTVW